LLCNLLCKPIILLSLPLLPMLPSLLTNFSDLQLMLPLLLTTLP
jgi:hypothetical protein